MHLSGTIEVLLLLAREIMMKLFGLLIEPLRSINKMHIIGLLSALLSLNRPSMMKL